MFGTIYLNGRKAVVDVQVDGDKARGALFDERAALTISDAEAGQWPIGFGLLLNGVCKKGNISASAIRRDGDVIELDMPQNLATI
jgi:hypothetical protein